jgi:hypothetical protein
MSWSLKFDEPIALTKGKSLRTLRDAANHIIALRALESTQEHWQTARGCLLSAAEEGGLVMMARIAMVRALHADKPDAYEDDGTTEEGR